MNSHIKTLVFGYGIDVRVNLCCVRVSPISRTFASADRNIEEVMSVCLSFLEFSDIKDENKTTRDQFTIFNGVSF